MALDTATTHAQSSAALPLLSSAGGAYTVSVWLRPHDPTQSGTVIDVGDGSTTLWRLRYTPDAISFITVGGTYSTSLPQPARVRSDGSWIVISVGSSGALMCVDGRIVVRDLNVYSLGAFSTALLAIGARVGGTDRWYGLVAEIATWNRTLSDADAVELSRGRAALDFLPPPEAYLPLRIMSSEFGGWLDVIAKRVVTGGDAVISGHPAVARARSHLRAGEPVIYARVSPQDGDGHMAVTRDIALATYAGLAPVSHGDVRIRTVTDVITSLSQGYYGIELTEPVTLELDSSSITTPRDFLLAQRPNFWLRGHEIDADVIVDSAARHSLTQGSVYATVQRDIVHPSEGEQHVMDFSGATGSYVAVLHAPRSFSLTPPWTVIVWCYPRAVSQQYLINAGSWALIYGYAGQQVEFFASGYTGTDPRTGSQISAPLNQWCMVAYTYDGTNWRAYKNGAPTLATTRTFGLAAAASTAYVGAATATLNPFNGKLAEIAIVPRALSEAEITQLWRASRGALGRRPRGYLGAGVQLYYADSQGAHRRLLRGYVTSASETEEAVVLTVSDAAREELSQPVPRDTIDGRVFGAARDAGAPIQVPFGEAIVQAYHIGSVQDVNPGEDYAVGVWRGSNDAPHIAGVWWDSAPDQPGFERAQAWIDVPVTAINVATKTVTAAGNVTTFATAGKIVRLARVGSQGWQIARIVSATYDSGTDTTAIVLTQIVSWGTIPSGCIAEIDPVPESGSQPVGTIQSLGNDAAVMWIQQTPQPRVVLISPGRNFSNGQLVGGIRILRVGSPMQIAAGEVTIRLGDYLAPSDSAQIVTLRMPIEYQGAVLARVIRQYGALWDEALTLALAEIAQPLRAKSQSQQWEIVGGALGGRRAIESCQRVVEDLLRQICGVLRDAGDVYVAHETMHEAMLVAAPPRGEVPMREIAAADRMIPTRIVARWGQQYRARAQRDWQILVQTDDYPGIAAIGSGQIVETIVLPYAGHQKAIDAALERHLAHRQADAERLRLVVDLGEALTVRPQMIIRRDASKYLGPPLVARRVRYDLRRLEAEIEAVPYSSTMQGAPRGTYASVFPQIQIPEEIGAQRAIATANLARNSNFAMPYASALPGWYHPSVAVTVRRDYGAVGGYVAALTPLSAPATFGPGISDAEGGGAPGFLPVTARAEWSLLLAMYADDVRYIEPRVVWYDSAGNVLGSATGDLLEWRTTGEVNGLGYPRWYTIARTRNRQAAYAFLYLRFIKASVSVQVDAIYIGRVDGRRPSIPPWSPSRRDAIGIGSESAAATGVALRTITTEITIAGGATTGQAVAFIPAGCALFDIGALVLQAGGAGPTWSLGTAANTTRFASGKALTVGVKSSAIAELGTPFGVGERYQVATTVQITLSASVAGQSKWRVYATIGTGAVQ
jgi:hypothetical protein